MRNVCEMLEAAAVRFPDKTAFSDPDTDITFRELLVYSKKLASRFIADGLMGEGERSVLFYMEK